MDGFAAFQTIGRKFIASICVAARVSDIFFALLCMSDTVHRFVPFSAETRSCGAILFSAIRLDNTLFVLQSVRLTMNRISKFLSERSADSAFAITRITFAFVLLTFMRNRCNSSTLQTFFVAV